VQRGPLPPPCKAVSGDGGPILSPQTCALGFVVAVPVLGVAAAKVKNRVTTRHVPTLAVLAAVSFLIMMFNVPIPDGTTGHAVGGALIAILLGPWAAVIAVTVALAFQALLFGDGGVLSFGVNVVTTGACLSSSPPPRPRRAAAAGCGRGSSPRSRSRSWSC
jgi:ABC-type Co2+ transport system permease subunit